MAKSSNFYICSNCNTKFPKWSGQCSACSEWNTLEEQSIKSTVQKPTFYNLSNREIVFADLKDIPKIREKFVSNIKEFDRVCGGGIVTGSAILVGGDPGIGKSTLLTQAIASLCLTYNCVYISGEESLDQLKHRILRLGLINSKLKISTSTSLMDILYSLEQVKPEILVIDSIQTMYLETVPSIPGSISQVKACANELISFCKRLNIALILIGHVTREGQIAGPKVLEHMVDCVLYFEGEKANNFRILRTVKNRFGPTDEIGIFEMSEKGLQEVSNPSALFLNDYLTNISGTAVFAGLEGTRPVLVETQSLLVPTVYAAPKRAVVGADANRLSMITAVLESKLGIVLSNKDIYLSLIGGLKIIEPGLDLAICASLLSSFIDIPLPNRSVFFGEISLSAQIRNIGYVEKRLLESVRLGFTQAIIPVIPEKQKKLIKPELFEKMKIIEITNLKQLLKVIQNNK